MRRFRIDTIEGDLIMHITVHNPPYEDKDVLSHTKLKLKDVKITDVTMKFEEEE